MFVDIPRFRDLNVCAFLVRFSSTLSQNHDFSSANFRVASLQDLRRVFISLHSRYILYQELNLFLPSYGIEKRNTRILREKLSVRECGIKFLSDFSTFFFEKNNFKNWKLDNILRVHSLFSVRLIGNDSVKNKYTIFFRLYILFLAFTKKIM